MSYSQPVKAKSRNVLWRHAVETLTCRRNSSRIFASGYMQDLWRYAWDDVLAKVQDFSSDEKSQIEEYFYYWQSFSDSCYDSKNVNELKVAYFSGPEPENDLKELLTLGIRIENIWAFESRQETYEEALQKARINFPYLKIFPGSLKDFLKTNHLLFDIIYLDFTAPLITKSFNTLATLHSVFDEQALSDLGVLVLNSCEPDPTDEICDFLAAYYNFQPLVECTAFGKEPYEENGEMFCNFIESATSHGYEFHHLKQIAKNNMKSVYSAFATSYPLYYSSFISPTLRFLKNPPLRRQLFTSNQDASNEAFDRLSDLSIFDDIFGISKKNNEDIKICGDRYLNSDGFPFWNFIETLKEMAGKLGTYWFSAFSNKNSNGVSILEAVRFRESLDETLTGYDGLLSSKIKEELRRVHAAIPDNRGGMFCDIPLPHLWLELALNQLGAPYHPNIQNHRRWTYKAKVRSMHLDAFTFDRCRSLYDFLPMVDMYGDVFKNLLPQITVRCCLDALGKQVRWPLPNLYMGSNIVCINEIQKAKFAELRARVELKD